MTLACTKDPRNKFFAAAFAGSLSLLAAGQAAADTYAVVINATGETISVGGAPLEPKKGAWTPLDVHVLLGDNSILAIKDMHTKCNDNSGWSIEASGKTTTSMCIELGFAEIGCIVASVSFDKSSQKERIDMFKTNQSTCVGRWWENSGKEIIFAAADRLIQVQGNAAEIIGAIVPKP